jgi:hypothetical protein
VETAHVAIAQVETAHVAIAQVETANKICLLTVIFKRIHMTPT